MTDTLKQWAAAGKLGKAKLSSDGTKLTLGDVTLDATQPLTVVVKHKTIQYSLASLFLQIVNPTQSLMAYRNACKQYKIQDVVKALDKPTVVAYFLGDQEGEEGEEEGAAKEESVNKERRSSSERRSKSHDRSTKPRDSKKRPSDTSAAEPEPSKKKKKKVPMTNEQLFDNLNIVVDKRSAKTTREDELLHQALSADGFEVSPGELAKHQAALESILPLEIPVGNSASILRLTTLAGRDFSRVLELYLETTKSSTSTTSSTKHKNKTSDNKKSDKSYLIGKKPVIVVPKGMTIPITMANAYEFFGNAKFVPRDLAKKQPQAASNTFSRKLNARLGAGLVEYELMDNPKAKLGENPREWERIVAVITLGQSWQFKDWPGPYKNAVHLFSRTYGFYIGMEGDKVPAELEGWAVRRGNLNRDKRGLDSVTHASFWNGLDEWMAVHKPELLPKS